MAARLRLVPGQVQLIFPRTRPIQYHYLTHEADVQPPGIYDPHVQADVAQFALARGDTYTYGLDYADQGASPDNIPGIPGAPGAPGGLPLPAPAFPGAVIEPDRFHRVARSPWSLTTSSVLVLPAAAPNTPRVFLQLLNKTASAGIVYIDFDQSAAAISAPVELQPGGYAFYDQFVPQNDIYAVAASTAILLVVFANGP